jgi:hypothetical protein
MNMAAKRKNGDLGRSGNVACTIDGDVASLDLSMRRSNHSMSFLPLPAAKLMQIKCKANYRLSDS